MLKIDYSNRFLKDMKLCRKRGLKLEKLKGVIERLEDETPLPDRCREHLLSGDWQGWSECHLEPDWLLIFKRTGDRVYLARTGTHADLFG